MRFPKEPRRPFNTSFPVWFLENLQRLSARKGEDANDLIMASMLKEHPELRRNASPLLEQLLAAKSE